jgi:hypothetical protein
MNNFITIIDIKKGNELIETRFTVQQAQESFEKHDATICEMKTFEWDVNGSCHITKELFYFKNGEIRY